MPNDCAGRKNERKRQHSASHFCLPPPVSKYIQVCARQKRLTLGANFFFFFKNKKKKKKKKKKKISRSAG